MKQGLTDKCRMCHSQPEMVEHIIYGYQTLVAEKYLNRHNQVSAELYPDICKYHDVRVDGQYWYKHKLDRVIENDKVTVPWDSQIITDRHIPCNNPDIVIKKKYTGKCLVIYVTLP